jgi:DNA-binding MarR family transcriptional regulator
VAKREPFTDVERKAWRDLDSVMTRIPAALDARLARESGMTHFQYRVLAALAEQPDGQLQQKELARLVDASLPRLSHVVDELVRRGWVRRLPVLGRRGSNAALTDGGCAVVEQATPVFLDAVRALVFDGLDKAELRQLLTVAQTLKAVTNGEA